MPDQAIAWKCMPIHLGEQNSISRCVPKFGVDLNSDGWDREKNLNMTVAEKEGQHIGL